MACCAGAVRVVGFGKPRCRHHDDVRDHPVVDVAADGDLSFEFEDDRFGLAGIVERQFETPGTGQRIDVMLHVVAVWQHDLGAVLHDGQEGGELLVFLGNLDFGAGRDGRGRLVEGNERDRCLGQRVAAPGVGEHAGKLGRRQRRDQAGQQEERCKRQDRYGVLFHDAVSIQVSLRERSEESRSKPVGQAEAP
jgi:hypothetical protein